MRLLLVVTLLSAVTFAGCTDDESPAVTSADCLEQEMILGTDIEGNPACVESPLVIEQFEDPEHYCVVNEKRDRLHAPDLIGNPWAMGQWWEYTMEVDGEDLGTTRLIYYANQDAGGALPLHYMVGTPTREEALVQAVDSINPVIGRVHSILYSPHESGDHADMFHFPLCEGSSWQTMFYGERFTVTARQADIQVADQTLPGYAISGTSAEGSTLALTYSPDAQWFTRIDLDRADGGTVTMDLAVMGTGQTGEAFFLRGQNDFHGELQSAPAAPVVTAEQLIQPFDRADGGLGPYDTVGFHVVATIQGYGLATLAINFPDGTIASDNYNLDGDVIEIDEYFEHPYQAGEWSVELDLFAASPDQAIQGNVVFDAVSIYDQSCTVGGDCLG